MAERYPGSPVEAGEFHPILTAHRSTPKGQMETIEVGREVGRMLSTVQEEITSGRVSDADSLGDIPAADRVIDLAIIGLLVERGLLRVPEFSIDDLSKDTLGTKVNERTKRALANNDEAEFDRIDESVHSITLTIPVTSAAAIVSALRYAGSWPMQKVHNMIVPQIGLQVRAARAARGLDPEGA